VPSEVKTRRNEGRRRGRRRRRRRRDETERERERERDVKKQRASKRAAGTVTEELVFSEDKNVNLKIRR